MWSSATAPRRSRYYNLACAYASWSLEEGADEDEKQERRDLALLMLTESVEAGLRATSGG